MADRPILFSAPMVRALIAGTKTQTRRILKTDVWGFESGKSFQEIGVPGQRFAVGDQLWVREAFSYASLDCDKDGTLPPWFWADGNPEDGDWTKPKPSIHMPRWASRLTLTVTDVRVQRLQDISEEDAIAEGIERSGFGGLWGWIDYSDLQSNVRRHYADPRESHRSLWGSINGPGSWDANPWIVAVSFEAREGNIDG